jgi:hypothetical protein
MTACEPNKPKESVQAQPPGQPASSGDRSAPAPQLTISKLRAALRAAGVEFIAENGGGVGVRLRKPADPVSPTSFIESIATALDALPERAKDPNGRD